VDVTVFVLGWLDQGLLRNTIVDASCIQIKPEEKSRGFGRQLCDTTPHYNDVVLGSVTDMVDAFVRRHMLELHEANGIEQLGSVKWQLTLCLVAVYLICYFSLWKGISTSGKVSRRVNYRAYVTTAVPLMRLIIAIAKSTVSLGLRRGRQRLSCGKD